ncbi:MAG: hypothetical protein K2Q18_11785 [Bdellovibrionales bacterium]|nr:hypothetical protein [Bdellovibrionales bacterium]
MKKFIISLVAALNFSTSAYAFVPQMEFFVNREVAVSRVWNVTNRPIICSGQAFGRTYQGVVLSAWINNAVIYPGVSAEVYVHSNFYDPMIQAWAQVDCTVAW